MKTDIYNSVSLLTALQLICSWVCQEVFNITLFHLKPFITCRKCMMMINHSIAKQVSHLLLHNNNWSACKTITVEVFQRTSPSHFLALLCYVKQRGNTTQVQVVEQQIIALVPDVMPSFFTETAAHAAKGNGRCFCTLRNSEGRFRTKCKQSCRRWRSSRF